MTTTKLALTKLLAYQQFLLQLK